jgi:type I site-specific restriction endonuclease
MPRTVEEDSCMSEQPGDKYLTPEAPARVDIVRMLGAAGWTIQDRDTINLYEAQGVAVREYLLAGNTEAAYLLFVNPKAVGALEAKKAGSTLTGVEPQTAKYASGLPAELHVPVCTLPSLYESTGVETGFTNSCDPNPQSREVFAVHRPETYDQLTARDTINLEITWLKDDGDDDDDGEDLPDPDTLIAEIVEELTVAAGELAAAASPAYDEE